MNIRRHTNKILLTIFTLALTLASTPTKIKSEIPAIKGLYTIFTPDVIGIGQALKTKGWIENVYDFAPEDNLARKVIKKFWHKEKERDQESPLNTTKMAPISEITARTFGQILNYAINLSQSENKSEKLKEILIENWMAECQNYINTEAEKEAKKLLEKEIEKEDYKIKLNNLKLDANKKINEKIKKDIRQILSSIKNLIASSAVSPKIEVQEFFPEMAESILWAFFEDKFTSCKDEKDNLDKCLKEIIGLNFDITGKKEYPEDSCENFEKIVKKTELPKKIILKIKKEYDESTHCSIKISRIKVVPPLIKTPYMTYNKSLKFSTCFEGTILDAISILLYNPTARTYDPTILPTEHINLESDLFKDIFKTSTGKLIKPININKKYQEWIDVISNRPWIQYNNTKKLADDKKISYEIHTTLESFLKIFNEFYNLGFDIDYDSQKSSEGFLRIKNFEQIIGQTAESLNNDRKPVQAFWDNILEFISKKLSTADRDIEFIYLPIIIKEKNEYTNYEQIFKITNKIIETKESIGRIKVKIAYKDKNNEKFNTIFILNLSLAHSDCSCEQRKNFVTIDFYTEDFKKLLAEKVTEPNSDKKLMPLFIILAQNDMPFPADIRLQNIYLYCLNLKNDNTKLEIIKKLMALNSNQYDKSLEELAKNLTENLIKDKCTIKNYMKEIFDKTHKLEEYNSIAQEILKKLLETNHIISFELLSEYKNISKNFIYVLRKTTEKIDLNKADLLGHSPISHAINANNKELVEFFLQKVSIKNANQYGNTPLHVALQTTNINKEIIKMLLAADININAIDPNGNTLLHLALQSKNSDIEIIKSILAHKNNKNEYDINLSLKNTKNKTPLDLAQNLPEIKLLIEEKIKEIEAQKK